VFKALASKRRARRNAPLGDPGDGELARFASIPHGSLASIGCGDTNVLPRLIVTGPARYRNKAWSLPVFQLCDQEITTARSGALEWRRRIGVVRRSSYD
jgi:hypothetical protein